MNLQHHYDDKGNYLGCYEEDSPAKKAWRNFVEIIKFIFTLPGFPLWIFLGVMTLIYLLPLIGWGLIIYLTYKKRPPVFHSTSDAWCVVLLWLLPLLGLCYFYYGYFFLHYI